MKVIVNEEENTALKEEHKIAQELLNYSEQNMEMVFGFLTIIYDSFSDCHSAVGPIKCAKKKGVQLERNFASVSTSTIICNAWLSLLQCSGFDSESCNVVLQHILQHFWSCLVLYHSKGSSHIPVQHGECLPTTSATTSVENIELEAITEHSGWVCKRVRDIFKGGDQIYQLQVSKENENCINVPKP